MRRLHVRPSVSLLKPETPARDGGCRSKGRGRFARSVEGGGVVGIATAVSAGVTLWGPFQAPTALSW
jgi:hypothetical protein